MMILKVAVQEGVVAYHVGSLSVCVFRVVVVGEGGTKYTHVQN